MPTHTKVLTLFLVVLTTLCLSPTRSLAQTDGSPGFDDLVGGAGTVSGTLRAKGAARATVSSRNPVMYNETHLIQYLASFGGALLAVHLGVPIVATVGASIAAGLTARIVADFLAGKRIEWGRATSSVIGTGVLGWPSAFMGPLSVILGVGGGVVGERVYDKLRYGTPLTGRE